LGTRNNYCIYSIIIILAAGGFCQAESRAEERRGSGGRESRTGGQLGPGEVQGTDGGQGPGERQGPGVQEAQNRISGKALTGKEFAVSYE